jgi:hypothetical protein
MILEASLHYAWEGVHNREAHILVARKGVGRERERERERERKKERGVICFCLKLLLILGKIQHKVVHLYILTKETHY